MTIGTELDAALAAAAATPAPTPPFDPTTINSRLSALETSVAALQAAPPTPAPPQDVISWQTVPTITFTQGVAGTFSVAGFVTSSLGLALTLTLNAVALPAGVTFDATGKRFVYDGVGPAAITTGHILTASDQ